MRLRKLLRSRKAISPILATLLLIVIAVAAIVVTYAWIMTYMGNAGRQAGVMLQKANVSFYTNMGTKRIDVDVINTGTSDTEITRVYIGLSASNRTEHTPIQTLPLPLTASHIARITLNYNWTTSTVYYFKVLSSSGQYLELSEPVAA